MKKEINWNEAIQPLIEKYKGKKYSLNYKNLYQLVVMLILSAQDSNRNINNLAPKFFEAFPAMASLSKVTPDSLYPLLNKIRNFGNKVKWLIQVGSLLKEDINIPLTMEGLTALPGIGRKSANIVLREFGKEAKGAIVNMHVIRVANRLGISHSENPAETEKHIMKVIQEKDWAEASMGMSFLGEEICRNTNPNHEACVMKNVCSYYAKISVSHRAASS